MPAQSVTALTTIQLAPSSILHNTQRVNVKKDVGEGYRFGLVSEQSVYEVVSGIQDAVVERLTC
jgi:hypothetical protein